MLLLCGFILWVCKILWSFWFSETFSLLVLGSQYQSITEIKAYIWFQIVFNLTLFTSIEDEAPSTYQKDSRMCTMRFPFQCSFFSMKPLPLDHVLFPLSDEFPSCKRLLNLDLKKNKNKKPVWLAEGKCDHFEWSFNLFLVTLTHNYNSPRRIHSSIRKEFDEGGGVDNGKSRSLERRVFFFSPHISQTSFSESVIIIHKNFLMTSIPFSYQLLRKFLNNFFDWHVLNIQLEESFQTVLCPMEKILKVREIWKWEF